MTIRFEYSVKENAKALSEMPERRAILKYWWPICIAMIASMFGYQALQGHLAFRSIPEFLLFMLIMLPVIGSFVLMPYWVQRIDRSRSRRLGAARTDFSETRTFAVEGFLSSPAWSDTVPWSFVTKAVESEHFFYVYHAGAQQAEYVPKSAMSGADINQLRTILRNRLDAHSAELKLFPAQHTSYDKDAPNE